MPEITQNYSCIIGVDVGTSSTKISAYTQEGNILASAQESYPLLQPQPGYAEQDPEVICSATLSCIGHVCLGLPPGTQVEALSFSAAMHGIMAIDQNGNTLTPILTWADTRSQDEAAEIRQSINASDIYTATGVPIHPMSPLCKLRWLRKNRPALMQQAVIFAGIKEYLIYRLTGRWLMDQSMASATGMFDILQLQWHPPALEWAGIRKEQLPDTVGTMEVIQGINDRWVKEWGISSDCKLIPGASDGCLANLGSGAMETGQLALTVGTSGAVRMTVSNPRPDPGGRTFNYILMPGYFVTGGPVNNGGIILKWFSEQILDKKFDGAKDFNWFLDEAAKTPPGADGLICLPYFMGERAPCWNAAVKGLFYGMRLTHNRSHMMRALVEGICFSLYQVSEIVSANAGPYNRILASGGFTQSGQWMQWIADIFGRTVQVAQDNDASATGAAMLGWMAIGRVSQWSDFKSWVQIRQSFEPGKASHEIYQDIFKEYKALAGWEDKKKH
jgi:gluconokinase